jgi:hypothetical protein
MIVLAVPFVGLALVNALHQHQHYVNLGLVNQSMLQDILMQAPQLAPDTFILVVDDTMPFESVFAFTYGLDFDFALQHLYNDYSLDAKSCPSQQIQSGLSGICQFTNDQLEFTRDLSPFGLGETMRIVIPSDRLLIFETEADGRQYLLTSEQAAAAFNLSGYDPQSRIVGSTRPIHSETLFSCDPALACYRSETELARSLELPVQGEIGKGWRGTESDGQGGTFRWSVSSVSSVDTHLETDLNYVVEFRISHWLEAEVIDSLKLSFGGHDMPLTWEWSPPAGRIYRALIRQEMVAKALLNQRLVFTVDHLTPVPDAPDVHLGFGLNWLRIRPAADSTP